MNDTYIITRMYFSDDIPNQVIRRGLTLEEAQEHCSDPETSSSTCTQPHNTELTEKYGMWFDGYDKENR